MNKVVNPLVTSEHFQKLIKWINGVPVPAYQKNLTSPGVQALSITALSLPYQRTSEEIKDHTDEEFEGMTNGEVAMVRIARQAAGGDQEALKILLDRVLGKPKFQAEIKSLKLNYADYIKDIARQEESAGKVVDVEGTVEPDENNL